MKTMDPQPELQSVLPFSSSWKQCLLLSLSKSQNPLLGSSLSQCPCSVCPGASTCHPKARAYWPGHPGLLKPFLLHWSYPACWIPWFHLKPSSLLVLSSSAPPWLSVPLSPLWSFHWGPLSFQPCNGLLIHWFQSFSCALALHPFDVTVVFLLFFLFLSLPLISHWLHLCLLLLSSASSNLVLSACDLAPA